MGANGQGVGTPPPALLHSSEVNLCLSLHCEPAGADATNDMFAAIQGLIIRTLLAVQPAMIQDRHCFEVTGQAVIRPLCNVWRTLQGDGWLFSDRCMLPGVYWLAAGQVASCTGILCPSSPLAVPPIP
jgi:hypothetical protein